MAMLNLKVVQGILCVWVVFIKNIAIISASPPVYVPDIPEYFNPCNSTVYLGLSSGIYASTINFYYQPSLDDYYTRTANSSCSIKVETSISHRIRYQFNNVELCEFNCTCANSLSVLQPQWEGYLRNIQYCSSEAVPTRTFLETQDYAIEFLIDINATRFVKVNIDLYTVHNGVCHPDEVRCGVCVHETLACGIYDHKYCRTPYDVCSDDTTDRDYRLILGAVSALTVLVVGLVACCVCYNCVKKLCCEDSPQQNRSRREVCPNISVHSARVMAGTSSEHANVNQAYELEDRPPSYSCLQNLNTADQQTIAKVDAGSDLPPSYAEVVQNRDKYKIVIDEAVV